MKKILLSIVALCAASAAMAEITIDQVAGYYQETYSITGDGTYVYSYTDAVDSIKITKTSDATVTIYGLLGDKNAELEAIVDLSAKTLTIAPQTVHSWYTLCGATETDPVIATIADDGTISFEGANLSYYNTAYGKDAKATLVRYADNNESVSNLFTVDAQVYCYDYNTMDVLYTGMTTLTKSEGVEYPYAIADYDGNGKGMKFKTDDDGNVLINESPWNGWSYLYYQYWCGSNNDYMCLDQTGGSEIVEDETGAENGGSIVLTGWWYEDYDNYLETAHGMYYYVNWGADYIFDTAINTVEAEKNNTPAFLLNGVRANNAKGLQVRNGKVQFVK